MEPTPEQQKQVGVELLKMLPSPPPTYWSKWLSWWQWRPTSQDLLYEAEEKMLAKAGIPFEQWMVPVGQNTYINTLKAGQGPPLVLLHGFGAGIGFWVCNLKKLSENHTVYAVDLPGFGRSSRLPLLSNSFEASQEYFVGQLEAWRKAMGLNEFSLLGHSFGGYLASLWALHSPKHVKHLILADPWGVPARPAELVLTLPWHWKILGKILLNFNPLATVRAAGPYGPGLVQRFRRDLPEKFVHLHSHPSVVSQYIYHLNAQYPSGETAFANMSESFGWAKKPLLTFEGIESLPSHIKVSLLYGEHTWMDRAAGRSLQSLLGSRASFHLIRNAGHHIYVDNHEEFHTVVSSVLRQ